MNSKPQAVEAPVNMVDCDGAPSAGAECSDVTTGADCVDRGDGSPVGPTCSSVAGESAPEASDIPDEARKPNFEPPTDEGAGAEAVALSDLTSKCSDAKPEDATIFAKLREAFEAPALLPNEPSAPNED